MTDKKTWIEPKLESLEVKETLGGTVNLFLESQFNVNATDRGSYPG